MIVNYYGGFGTSYGYGSATEQLAIALNEVGVDIRVMRTAGARGVEMRDDITPKGKALLTKTFAKGDVAICFGHPPFFDVINSYKYRIGYTMFESDKLPDATERNPDWVKQCNKLTRLWVPSESSKQIFQKAGVTVPIDVVRNGVDPELFPIYNRPKREVFTFLMYGVLTIRKNPGYALSAFLANFKDNPKVHLILKTQSGTLGHLSIPEKNVTIIDRKYDHKDLLDLLESADAFVFPSRGEGFGLPPLEAMATGLPTIVSANSGMLEYTNERYNFPVKCPTLVKTSHVPKHWGDIGNWWQPDYEDLKQKMKFVYENQDLARQKGMDAATWVRQELTWAKAAEKGKEIIEEMVKP